MKGRSHWVGLVFLLSWTLLASAAGHPAARSLAPWAFQANFADGLTGWMSFPLAQDIGFDPTLFTEHEGSRTVLVRKVQPLGRKRLLLGIIRPLKFFADPATRIQFKYALRLVGRVAGMKMILAGANGRRYSYALPSEEGSHTMEVTGAELRLPARSTRMQAVVLLVTIDEPPARAYERLTIRGFELHAERPPEVDIVSPALARSETGEEIVSRQILGLGSSLKVTIRPSSEAATVDFEAPNGKQVKKISVPASQASISVPLGADPTPGLWRAKIRRGPSETDFNFLVLGQTPSHPRILLQEKRLEQLRTLPRYAGLRQQIHRQAQRLTSAITYNVEAGANIAHLPGGTGLHPAFVGELKSYFKLLESYASAISYDALDYSLNAYPASLDAARRALLTVAKWKTWTPPRFSSRGEHTYYEVGIFAQHVAFGYDLIAPELSAQEKQEIAGAFWRQVIQPTVDEYFLDDRMPLAASNWMANSLGGAIAAAVATEGDVPGWRAREGVALAELTTDYERLLKGLFPGDGSEAEPAGYENFAMEGLSWGAAALHALGIRPKGLRRMWEGFWWPCYAMVNPGLVLDTGDFDGQLERLCGFAWGAEHAGIPALREFYDRSKPHLSFSATLGVRNTGRKLEQEAGPLDLVCCTKPASRVAPPPPSRIFPRRGSAVLRSGWGPRSTVISMRVGAWFNHEHHDEGSFQVAAFGQKLISEAGYSGYYDDPNYPVYFIQAAGHNTVLIDGNPFSQANFEGRYWAAFSRYPHFTDQLLSPAFDYLAADLTSAYAGQLSHYERDYVFIKPDVLVVRDCIVAPRPHVYTLLLHAPAAAKIGDAGDHATIHMPSATASVLAVGSASGWGIRATPISITRFDNLDQGVIHTPHEFYLKSARGPAANFLVGMLFTADTGAGPKASIEELKSSTGEGIMEEGSTPLGAIFRTHSGALRLRGFATDGDVLAVRGSRARADVLAVGAKTVEARGKLLFRSNKALSVAWRRDS
ncbi:MAG: heparinase II/III-family protein, partial [Acidobacteria bacterium]|nr:heparinase II/III-family protein [Acidobacteriota bacterium]